VQYLILATMCPKTLAEGAAAFSSMARSPVRAYSGGTDGSIRLLIEEPPVSPNIAPKVPFFDDGRIVTFFDGLPVHSEFNAFDAEQLATNWSESSGVLGRFTLLRFDKVKGRAELHLDSVASCPVYHGDLPHGGWLITNVARLAHAVAVPGDLDTAGASGLLCTEAPLGLATLTTTVRVLPCSSWVNASVRGGLVVKCHDALAEAGKQACDMTASEAATQFGGLYSGVIEGMQNAGFKLQCAITGGRDSRALAALFASVIDEPRFYFGGVERAKESEIARATAAKLGGFFELVSGSNNPTEETFTECERYLFSQDCGMGTFNYLRSVPVAEPDPNDSREVHMTGHGGEFARWSYESLASILQPPSVQSSINRLTGRLISTGDGLFTPAAIDATQTVIRARIYEALQVGVTRMNLQSVVANQLKTRSWAAWVARSAERRDVFAPFLSAPFFDVAMRLPPYVRFADGFHKELIRRFAPAALEIQFCSYTSTRQRFTNEIARSAIGAFSPLKKLYHKRKRPTRHAKWEPWLRPLLRDRLLAHDANSPVWDFVSRQELEQILVDSTGHQFRTRVYDLLRSATLIRFWDAYSGGDFAIGGQSTSAASHVSEKIKVIVKAGVNAPT
jgi:hypothetical protein